MTTAVFDCMVFLQAATNEHGPAFACLELVEAKHVTLYISPAILAEVREVLARHEIRAKFPHLTDARVDLFIEKLAALGVVVQVVPDAGHTLRDPDDLPYLDLAIASHVSYLVSWDKDLRDLVADETFLKSRPNLHIVDPVTFLNAVRSTTVH